jgi:hypothetical protein
VDDTNLVAMQFYQSVPKVVQVKDGTVYGFMVQNNISLAWVHPDHVQQILTTKRSCCNGRSSVQFFIASEIAVRLWQGLKAR